ncbi:hypothetical protein NQ317_006482 [Molorchus minor]|uniref:Uncharacterized protein n=1 Tax=Molorchus minor TaxID=1323400 RepID=A0ABQ9J592_9CUCU|nr:hypothetical protein NQ317_006482 [Molorchus minor]
MLLPKDDLYYGGVMLTPRKREVWWPPYKQQTAFEKALKKGEVPNETWTLCKVARSFFEEELVSDVQSEIEDNEPTRRRISKPRRLSYSSDEEPLSALPLPPKIKAPNKYTPHKDVLSCTREVTSSPKSVISIESEGQASGTLAPPLVITKDVGPDFNAKFLSLLIHVKEQNSQILKILKTNKPVGVPIVNELPDDIPVQFPVSSFDDLKQVEEYLNDLLFTLEDETTLIGKYFKCYLPLYTYPFKSQLIHIHKVTKLSQELKAWSLNEIRGKCMVLPFKDEWVSLPLFHTV